MFVCQICVCRSRENEMEVPTGDRGDFLDIRIHKLVKEELDLSTVDSHDNMAISGKQFANLLGYEQGSTMAFAKLLGSRIISL